MEVLAINNLSKSYGKVKALDNLNLKIEAGNVYGLLGPNGSGKTTTLGIILGILSSDTGSFKWFDGKYGDNPRKKIGSILETPNFYPYLTASENLEIVRRIKKADKSNFDHLLKKVDLYERRRSKFQTYSLGMKQRLAIASTLIGNPEVLIFDEPTNGLDPQGIAEVRSILKNIASEGKTVILASHILDEVEKICSHVAIIRYGKLLASGGVGAILSDDNTLELGSSNLESIISFMSKEYGLNKHHKKGDILEFQVDKSLSSSEVNKQALSNGIELSHLVLRKQRLEEEFLQITSK
jgi:ABC-2 type transport system ATP-binding protein